MKKLLPLLMVLFLAAGLSAQVNIVYFEDFTNGMPADYNIVDKDGKTPDPNVGWPANTAWRVVAGEARSISWYAPVAASDDWMITGAIEVPTVTNADNKTLLSWYARAVDPSYPDGYEVYVGTAGNKPEDFTLADRVFNINAEVPSPGITRAVDVSAFEGQTIYVAFRNNSFDKFILVVDDILIAETAANDAGTVRVTNRAYNPMGNLGLALEVVNNGSAAINSMVLTYTIDGGSEVTGEITGLNIPPLGVQSVTHPVLWDAAQGLHEVDIWVAEVNGDATPNGSAGALSTELSIYDPADAVARKVIVEGFSSATCPPCAPANTTFHNLLNSLTPANRPITVKYQLSFPSPGDPYTTIETENRASYYAVTGIPDSRVDGDFWVGLTGSVTSGILTNAGNRAGLASFDLKYTIDTAAKTVHIFGDVIPSADMLEGTRLMMVIKETTTVNNKMSNGETIFRNIVKKMINGNNGISLAGLKAGETHQVDVTYTFPGNYRLPINGQAANRINLGTEHSVENFANLAVSAWVEYGRERFILNAADAEQTVVSVDQPSVLSNFRVYPNPTVQDIIVDIELVDGLEAQITLFNAEGKAVRQIFNGQLPMGVTSMPVSLSDVPAGSYFLHLRSAQGVTIQNIQVVR